MQAPFKPIEFLSRDVSADRRADGTIVLQSNHKLKPYEKHVPALLARWAAEAPDRVWLAQRRGADRQWLKVTYAEAKRQVDAVTQALLDRGFGPDKPVMILSSNSIEFALLTMAAMQARAPIAPVSPAYSVMSQDHAKLRYVFDLIKPGLVFVQNGEIYARALAALDLEGVLLVHVDKAPPERQSLPWSELVATPPTAAVAASIERIEPDGIVTADGRKTVIDTLVLATGFNLWESAFPAFEVVGREDYNLGKFWRDNRFQAFEGIAVPKFPNLLTLNGPYSYSGLSYFDTIESQMRHIKRLFGEMARTGTETFEVTDEANTEFLNRMVGNLDNSVFYLGSCQTARSYYFNQHGEAALLRPTSTASAYKEQESFPLEAYQLA